MAINEEDISWNMLIQFHKQHSITGDVLQLDQFWLKISKS